MDKAQPGVTELTGFESKVVENARLGAWSVGARSSDSDYESVADFLARTEDPDLVVRGEVLRDLLLGRWGEVDPRGVCLAGLRITGQLDLDHVSAVALFRAATCVFDQPVRAESATLPELILTSCLLPALLADNVRLDGGLSLGKSRVTGSTAGTVRLWDARIGRRLAFHDTRLTAVTGNAVVLDRAQVRGDMTFADAKIVASNGTAVRMVGVIVDSTLNFDKTSVTSSGGPAVIADGATIGGHLVAIEVQIDGDSAKAVFGFPHAEVKGCVHLDRSTFRNRSGSAVSLGGTRISRDLTLSDAVFAGKDMQAALRLSGTRVGGSVTMQDVSVINMAGPGVDADDIQVDESLHAQGIIISGQGKSGAMRLLQGHIGGNLALGQASIVNTTGPALVMDSAAIGSDLSMQGAILVAMGEIGAARLVNGRIACSVDLTGATLANTTGPALVAAAASITGGLLLRNAELTSEKDNTVILSDASITGGVSMRNVLFGGDNPFVNMADATVGIFDVPIRSACPAGHCYFGRSSNVGFELANFTYSALEGVQWKQWLHLIQTHTFGYQPSPYQKLAATERAAGHDANARRILIAQQDDFRRLAPEDLGGPLTRFSHQLWGLVAGYGYRARRTAMLLLFALVVAGFSGWTAGHTATRPGHFVAERVASYEKPAGTPCTTVELIGLGLDRGIPLAFTGLRSRCDIDTASTKGGVFTVAIWLLQLTVWGLATLAIAGYTSLIRKAG